jgi:zinc protease
MNLASQRSALKALPGADDITRVELPNGIVVLSRPNFSSPSVVLTGYLNSGSLFDPPEKLGLAHFTAAGLMRGTHSKDFQQIYDILESIGASMSFGSGMHTTGFNARSLSEDLPVLLQMLREVLQEPAFPSGPLERLRAQLLTGLAIRNQDTGDMASMAFDELIYGSHPYSKPEDGHPDTILAIQLEDLAAYHRTYYGPAGMVIAIVGGVDPQAAVDQVSAVLGSWQNPLQPEPFVLPPVEPLSKPASRRIALEGKSQADLLMGCLGPFRRSADYMAASLGNSILGQFGMMGRIGDVVREQAGLAYYAYTSLNAGLGPGTWQVSAGVNPANLAKAEDLIRSEIARFIAELVSEEELGDSQANFIGRLPLSLESNNGTAGAILNLERYNLGLDYYRQYPGMVKAVTRQDILEASRHYLNPDQLATASAGPK